MECLISYQEEDPGRPLVPAPVPDPHALHLARQQDADAYLDFINNEKDLVDQRNFLGVMDKGVADVEKRFGHKHDSALEQMYAYTRCLKSKGEIK